MLGRTRTNQKWSAGALRGTEYLAAILIDLTTGKGLHRAISDLAATEGDAKTSETDLTAHISRSIGGESAYNYRVRIGHLGLRSARENSELAG